MEVKIIKNEKNEWKFPCKGISKINNAIVGFLSYGKGTILDTGEFKYYKLYDIKDNWNMDNFKPLLEEKQPINWDKVELPIWAKDRVGRLIQIISIKGVELKYFRISNEAVLISDILPTQGLAKQWLNSLEILPQGTKIEITI